MNISYPLIAIPSILFLLPDFVTLHDDKSSPATAQGINPATALHKCQDQATGSVLCSCVHLQIAGSLEDTTTRITMITFLSLIFLSLGSMGNNLEGRRKSEIDSISNEAKNLAEDMTELLKKVEKEGAEIFQNEDLYKELVDKIEDLAQATEEENLIKLTETVKDRRIQEEEFQDSLSNLQYLADKLEQASLSSHNKNEKEREMFGILESAKKTYLK